LSLKSTAVIEGVVSVAKLAVEPGATFNASCTMRGRDGKVAMEAAKITATNGTAKTS